MDGAIVTWELPKRATRWKGTENFGYGDTGGIGKRVTVALLLQYPMIFLYEKVLFDPKKRSLQAIVTVTEVLCTVHVPSVATKYQSVIPPAAHEEVSERERKRPRPESRLSMLIDCDVCMWIDYSPNNLSSHQ